MRPFAVTFRYWTPSDRTRLWFFTRSHAQMPGDMRQCFIGLGRMRLSLELKVHYRRSRA